jgi:pimeloyl-ACP methyl ester carboxylesterase
MLLHVRSHGDGRPVIVLPSFSLDHAAMAEALEPAFSVVPGWRRSYIDLPGTGGTPSGTPSSDAVLDDVVATIRAELADRPFVVVGWSYGGYLAAGLARRLRHQVRGMMMVCTSFRIRPEDRDLTGVLASAPAPDWLAAAPPHLHDHFTLAVGRQTREVAQRLGIVLGRNGPVDERYLASLRTDGYALSDETAPTPCEGPVYFLSGRRDRIAGYAGLFAKLALYDHADYMALGDAGHYLPVEQPGRFATAARSWLEQCEAFLEDGLG